MRRQLSHGLTPPVREIASRGNVRNGWKADMRLSTFPHHGEPSMRSAYQRGKRHLVVSGVVAIMIIWGVSVAAPAARAQGQIAFALLAIWLLYCGARGLMIGCPQCGQSVFVRGLY